MLKDYRKALKYCKLSKCNLNWKLVFFSVYVIILVKHFCGAFLFYLFAVLEFEPNNVTAKEFYPLIQEKMKCKFSGYIHITHILLYIWQ